MAASKSSHPVEVGSLSHDLQGFSTIPGDFFHQTVCTPLLAIPIFLKRDFKTTRAVSFQANPSSMNNHWLLPAQEASSLRFSICVCGKALDKAVKDKADNLARSIARQRWLNRSGYLSSELLFERKHRGTIWHKTVCNRKK